MIFLSYRRADTAGHAGRLFDRLADHFGRDQVFMDVDTIQPGEDFAHAITQRIGSCDVLIALIGDQWLSATDSAGKRRVDDPLDFVRAEITAALERGIPVIPVLVEGAGMPGANSLPDAIRGLVRLQALEIRDTRFDAETRDLIQAIERHLRSKGVPAQARPFSRRLVIGGAGILLVAGIWGVWQASRPEPTPDLTGRWIAEVTDSGNRTFNVILDLRILGEQVVGTVEYPTGSGGIREGRLEGGRVTFMTEHHPQFAEGPATTRFVAEVKAGELHGTMQNDAQARPFIARRGRP